MASIVKDPGGRRRLLFFGPDGKRHTLRLGKVSEKQASEIRRHVEHLVACDLDNSTPDLATTRWVSALSGKLRERFERAGLAEIRGRTHHTLADFTRDYIKARTDLKPGTIETLERARTLIVEFFGEAKPLSAVTIGDAKDFHRHLGKTLAPPTVHLYMRKARQFYGDAADRKLITENPFAKVKVRRGDDDSRQRFISAADVMKVIDACPDQEWRAVFALARFGGLRVSSETEELKWSDIRWDQNEFTVTSPKTEHHPGRESRVVPLYPELRPHLLAAFEAAEPGAVYVTPRLRGQNVWRTAQRIVTQRAGLVAWPKLFVNLRSTRQTELEERFPSHVVCKWMGNTESVARRHYLQVTPEHFKKATAEPKAAQKEAQQASADGRTGSQSGDEKDEPEPAVQSSANACGTVRSRPPIQRGLVRAAPGRREIGTSEESGALSGAVSHDSANTQHGDCPDGIAPDVWTALPPEARAAVLAALERNQKDGGSGAS